MSCIDCEDCAELQGDLDDITEGFEAARQRWLRGDVKEALFELEKALPDTFVGFAEDVIKHFGGKI